jgi:hypothetical protein
MRAKYLIAIIGLLLALALSAALYAHQRNNQALPFNAVNDPQLGLVIPDHVIVIFASGTPPSRISSIISDLHASVISTIPPTRTWLLWLPWSKNTTDLKQAAVGLARQRLHTGSMVMC